MPLQTLPSIMVVPKLEAVMRFWVAVMLFCFSISPLSAAEIGGATVPDQAVVEGKTLKLNGAGIRSKFFIDIYIGALYLPQVTASAEAAIRGELPKRVSMHILYDKVDRDKLVDGWVTGFEKNQNKAALAALSVRLNEFSAMFTDTRQGEVLAFDFLADGSTVVWLRGEAAGRIAGADFQQALLSVWLGDRPADRDLKEAMLQGGGSK